MEVISKFKPGKILFMMFVELTASFGFGYFLFSMSARELGAKEIAGYIFGCVCILAGLMFMYEYVTRFARLSVGLKGVRLKSLFRLRTFSWTEIHSIKYHVKYKFRSIVPFNYYFIEVLLKDKTTVNIFYEYYSNGHVIRQFIEHYEKREKELNLIEEQEVHYTDLANESFTTYKGIPLLSLRGASVWIFLVLAVVIALVSAADNVMKSLLIAGCLSLSLINALLCFYVEVSNNYLVLKNYFIPFLQKSYRLSDILELRTETYAKFPKCLRVVRKSFQYRIFPCACLRTEDWNALKASMDSKGLKIRN